VLNESLVAVADPLRDKMALGLVLLHHTVELLTISEEEIPCRVRFTDKLQAVSLLIRDVQSILTF
jgi:hypothetical protein